MRLIDALADPGVQYVVPVYQRVYSWTHPHCEALVRDSLAAAVEERPHFVGTVLHRPGATCGDVQLLTLIDGQQRLATLALLISVLQNRMREAGLPVPRWFEQCLTAQLPAGKQPKVVLSRPDRATFAAVMLGEQPPDDDTASLLVLQNRDFFEAVLSEPDFDVELLVQGLERLTIVVAELEDADRPQLVFESLNAKGMPLKTSDLIRNLLLTRLDHTEQVRLFKRYWEPLEDRFDAIEAAEKAERKSKIGIPPQDRQVEWEGLALDAALHGWLVDNSQVARPGTRAGLYLAFKTHVAENPQVTLEELLSGINVYCNRFADEFDTPRAREHINWAIGKPEGFGA